MSRRRFADVALPLAVDQPFTYEIPEALMDRAAPGMRAIVPVKNRMETGYILSTAEHADVEGIKPLYDLPDLEPLFADDMMELCRWIAGYYCCSVGEALHCAVPAGIHLRSKKRYTLLHDRIGPGRFTHRQRTIVAALHRKGPLTEKQIAKEVGGKALSRELASLEKRGLLMSESLVVKAGVSMRTETWVTVTEDAVLSIEAQVGLQKRAPLQAAVYLDMLHGPRERPAVNLYKRHSATSTVLQVLEDKGLIAREEREFLRTPEFEVDEKARHKHVLNEEQTAAYEAITRQTRSQRFATFLLQGVTGSGKTEVYLQAIEQVLDQGRDAIILVPEISLTPQTVGRFIARFDSRIAVLHSGLAPGERYDEWRKAQRGEVRIVVGARSAIFAPLPNVGIIIVDEEHDTSYKQGEVPRYHARDVAIMRANICNAVCVLGSATPSIESYYNSEAGKSQRLELTHRATRAELPKVQIVDMRIAAQELGGEAILSKELETAVNERVAAREQVILLLNRRGHSPFVLCPQCGWGAQCRDCNVSLTYHAKGNYLSCHYCNARRQVPQVCDECHFNPLIFLGTGTQKIEDYLVRAFPGARVERMDRDTTSGRGGHAKILGRFASGQIDILVGTQMIAKGHDYPRVTLVGVVHADTGLSVPDFRAGENAFQLLTQVAGRAGRGDKPGNVIIQTYRPRHYAILAAAQHDYAAFYAEEISQREKAAYPPYRRMLQFALESEDANDAERYVGILHRIVREQRNALGFEGIELLGPAPATIHRVKRKYRWNLGALSKSGKRLNTLARSVRQEFAAQSPKSVALKIDLDPYGMF